MFVREECCVHEEVLLGRGGAPLLICNQVRQTPQPHIPLSPPSRLSLFLSLPLLIPLFYLSSSPLPLCFFFPQLQWNSTFCQELDISIISLVILRTFLFVSPTHSRCLLPPPLPLLLLLLHFPILIYLCLFRPHLGWPHSVCRRLTES